jgi:hypothetical protein
MKTKVSFTEVYQVFSNKVKSEEVYYSEDSPLLTKMKEHIDTFKKEKKSFMVFVTIEEIDYAVVH